jgi:predicted porin
MKRQIAKFALRRGLFARRSKGKEVNGVVLEKVGGYRDDSLRNLFGHSNKESVMKKTGLVLCIALLVAAPPYAWADDNAMIQQMHDQMQKMQQQIDALSKGPAEPSGKQVKAGDQGTKKEKQPSDPGKAIQVYGQLRLSGDYYSNDFGDGKKGFTFKSNASRFGVKGEVPTSLPGTSMIYQAEVLYGAADNTTAEIEWREGYAGLKSGWGRVRLGRLDVPYKTTVTVIDPWCDSAPQSRGFGGRQGSSSLHSSYFNNTAEYLTPKFFGFTLGGWFSTKLDGEKTSVHNASPVTSFKGGDAKGVGVKLDKGPFFLGADFIDISADLSPDNTITNGSGWQVAARFKTATWSMAAYYEDVEDLGMGNNVYVNGTFRLGKFNFIGTVGRNTDAKFYKNRDINTWSLGTKYALTKDSELLIALVDRNEDAFGTTPGKEYRILTMGINAKFGY